MLDHLYLFITTVETGSLSAAAEKLGMTGATVSRQLSSLEAQLGHKLLHRTPRSLSLTREGQDYYTHCSTRLKELHDVLTDLDQQQNSISGSLRVLAPTNLAAGPLSEFWTLFLQKHPQINLRVDANNAFESLYQRDADLAIRIGKLPDSALIQKRLGYVNTIFVAKPGCWKINQVEHLSNVPVIASDVLLNARINDLHGHEEVLASQTQSSSNDLSVSKSMIKSGQAIGLLPESEVYLDIRSGELEHILPNWRGPHRVAYLVWSDRYSLSVRSKLFIESLTEYLDQQSWFHS